MKRNKRRLVFAILFALLAPLLVLAEEPIYTGNAELYIAGDFPEPLLAVPLSFYREEFEACIVEGVSSQLDKINVSRFSLTPEAFKTAYADAVNRHPELFYLSSKFSYGLSKTTGCVTNLYPTYKYAGDDLQRRIAAFNASVETVAAYASRAGTRIGKLLLANEYFCLNFRYDYTEPYAHAPDELFSSGSGVCQAYMLAYQAVLNRLGIPNAVAVSQAMNHVWNFVSVDGDWYHIDTTWNDPDEYQLLGAGYDHFLLSDDGVAASGHYSWTAETAAENPQYDDFFWRDSTMPLPMLGDTLYYTEIDEPAHLRTVRFWNIATGETGALFTYDARVNGQCAIRPGLDPLWVTDSRVYFAADGLLFSAGHRGEAPAVEYAANASSGGIHRLFLREGTLLMFIADSPGGDGAVVPLTPQEIAFSCASPVFDVSPGSPAFLPAALNGAAALPAVMTFSSADPSIAQIDETGLITGLSPGVTTVSAALGDTLSASCTVVVHGASSLRIPDGTRIIRDEAFLSAAAQEVVLPDSATSIGVRAFADNKSLRLINIPPNLVKIDPSAFAGSTDVLLLCTEGSVSAARIAAMGLRHVLLPAQTE